MRNALPMGQTQLSRSATTLPRLYCWNRSPDQVQPPETIFCHLSGCGLLCQSWIAKLAYIGDHRFPR
ncbi:hypothetical protein DPMN_137499 [Dreissena polymorpha]|uniref:Uncharacterized protein n=1 Tax=Dreissena polymorpha TaxID=45954 RepID=A0A9D4JDQ1_DREPO|nr:hypothetical protein DPMN_137499 [Dreissena polymorpha]